jgi:hypothetical protein
MSEENVEDLEKTKMQYLGRTRDNKKVRVKIFDNMNTSSTFGNISAFKHLVVGQIFFVPKSKDDTGWYLGHIEYGDVEDCDPKYIVADEAAKKERTQKTVAKKFDGIGSLTLNEIVEKSWQLNQSQKAQLIGLIVSRLL